MRLTRRQAEILALLAEALTTAEIGERLKLGLRTVEAHLRTLYRKIDVRSPHRGRALRGRARVNHRSSRSVIISPTEGTRRQDGAVR
jgi:DNA-binding NarL/FixJ family response regulator